MALMALALRPMDGNSWQRKAIIVLGLFGAALFYGDGVITPAISVLSAVEGLEVATPALKPYVMPLSLIILVMLFAVQRRGTSAVGTLFGPVMVHVVCDPCHAGRDQHRANAGILQALEPWHALQFFQANPVLGFFSLGAVVLALTGAEALYADMGHFGRRADSTRLVRTGVARAGAQLLRPGGPAAARSGSDSESLLPAGARLGCCIRWWLATAATVIASQAVISGAFSMTQQAIQLGFSPRMEISHTSDREIGQIYLPGINWTLLIAVLALVIGFGSSTNLAAAYGIAVTGTMFITDLLAFVVARYVWGWPFWRAFLGALPFAVIDLAFFSANSVKILDGGWFPLVFGLGVYLMLSTWKRGREMLSERLAADAVDTRSFIRGVRDVPRVPGTAVFLTPRPDNVPQAMLHSLKHYKVMHERVVLVSVTILDVPHLTDSRRVAVERMENDFWQVRIFYGFMEQPDLPGALEWCAEEGLSFDDMETSFFLGRETLIPQLHSAMSFWREKLFVGMFRNAGSAASFFGLPANRVVELGTQVVL
jgi:KUP system potassium uptake protein